MIIPIKCFTCGKVIADKYDYYCIEVRKLKLQKRQTEEALYFTSIDDTKTAEGIVLDEMGFTRMCCRRMMLTHVDI
jgi:DNA-directed RNA polymerase I, II, and III subunit RPABC5